MKVQVRDFMTTPVTVAEGKMSVGEIRALMQQKGIHAIPLVYTVDDELIIRGIITSSDLYCKMDENIPIEEAMKFSRVYVIPPMTSAKSAAEMMLKHHVHHIVVMEDGHLAGMISSLDFVKIVANYRLKKES